MKVGVFQFVASGNLSSNHQKIVEAITKANQENVRLLVFQECATCGYPPLEVASIKDIDFNLLDIQLQEIKQLAVKYNMYIGLGTIRKEKSDYYNAIQLISPNGEVIEEYNKRALWGWDLEHFTKGRMLGIHTIDGIKVGFRICFEVRFPEYFRELFLSDVKLCFVSFCDVSNMESLERYHIIKSHLVTRAVENVMTIISVDSISSYQTAPTAIFNRNGLVLKEAPLNQEYLMVYDYKEPEMGFGEKGRLQNAYEIIDENQINYMNCKREGPCGK